MKYIIFKKECTIKPAKAIVQLLEIMQGRIDLLSMAPRDNSIT